MTLTWKAVLALLLGGAGAYAIINSEVVATAFFNAFAGILTALGAF